MNIHPKLASGLFALIYFLIFGGLMFLIFKINLFDHVSFYVIGLIIDIIIYEWFAHRYDGDRSV